MKSIINKKGFTLVEVLGIAAILAIIMIISVPAVINMNKNSEKKDYERFLKDLEIATENYIQLNSEKFLSLKQVGGKAVINLQTLMDEGTIKNTTKNPDTKKEVSPLDSMVVTVQNNGILKYQYTNLDATTNGYIRDGLKLHYDMMEPTTGKIKDLSTSNYDGTLTGFDNVENKGWKGYGLLFDGVDSQILNSLNPKNDLGQTMTIQVHVYIEEGENYRGIFGFHGGDESVPFGILAQFESGSLHFAYGDGTTWQRFPILNTQVLQKWMTLTVVYKGSNYIKVYQDGNLIGTTPTTTNINLKDKLYIGNAFDQATPSRHFKGSMSNILVYNRELTAAEIEHNYKVDAARFSIE